MPREQNPNKAPFNHDIDKGIAERFAAQVEERRQIKYRAVESALRVWLVLPITLQAMLMSDECEDVYATLSYMIQRTETIKWFESLSQKERNTVSALIAKGLKDLSGLDSRLNISFAVDSLKHAISHYDKLSKKDKEMLGDLLSIYESELGPRKKHKK